MSNRRLSYSLLLVAAFLVACSSLCASQVWAEPLCVFSGDNLDFRGNGLKASDGSYFLVWQDYSAVTLTTWYQHFNSNHQALWQAPIAVAGSSSFVTMVETSDHHFLIFLANSQGNLYVYKINSAGEHLWSPDGVRIYTSWGSNSRISVAVDPFGGAFFTWKKDSNWECRASYINAAGIQASVYGLEISTSYNVSYPQVFCLPDGDAIFYYVQDNSTRMLRLNSSLQQIWVQQPPETDSIWGIQMIDGGDGSFYRIAYNRFIKVMRYSYAGVAMWAQDLWIEPEGPNFLSSTKAIKTGDGKILVSWAKSGNLYLQKLDANANVSLAPDFIAHNSPTTLLSINLLPAADNGAFVSLSYEVSNTIKVCAAYIDETGFAADTLSLIASYPRSNMLALESFITLINWNLTCFYEYLSNGQAVVQNVSMSQAGAVSPNANTLFEGDYGIVSFPVTVPRENNLLSIWMDKDIFYGSWPYRFRLKYQIITPQGLAQLPNPGLIPANGNFLPISNYRAVQLDDGNTLVVWMDMSPASSIRAQLIDNSGNQLWEPDGRIVYQGSFIGSSAWEPFLVEKISGAVYIFWPKLGADNFVEVHAQKLVNGGIQWGNQGLCMLDYSTIGMAGKIELKALHDDYLIYEFKYADGSHNGFGQFVGVLRFAANGQVLPAFSSGGLQLQFPSATLAVGYKGSLLTPQGLALRMDYAEEEWDEDSGYHWVYTQPYCQVISPSGQRLWGQFGIGNFKASLLSADDSGVYLRYDTPTNQRITKVDYSGNVIWNTPCYFQYAESYANNFPAVKSTLGSYLGAGVYAGPVFYYYFFSADGTVHIPTDSRLELGARVADAHFSGRGAYAYASWGVNGYDNSQSSTHLFIQKLDAVPTSIDEPSAPIVNLSLAQNYPNPFKSKTTLTLNVKQPQQAKVSIYNLKGQLVRVVYDGRLDAGINALDWDAKDNSGNDVASGIYLYSVSSESANPQVRKMMMIK